MNAEGPAGQCERPAPAPQRWRAAHLLDRLAVFGLATPTAYALLALATRATLPSRDLALAHLADGVPLFERTLVAAFLGAGAALVSAWVPGATARLLERRGAALVALVATLAAAQALLAP